MSNGYSARGSVSPRTAHYSLPSRTANQPVQNLIPTANEPATTTLSGERRVATVIFADVKGSTELLEQIGTEAWVEVMNNVFQVLETEIYRYGGEVGQFRGDGLVALFGAKLANEDDPEHAVLTALAMQEAIIPYASDLSQNEGIHLSMRVGVNTGEVIVANVGDAQYSEDTAMGEALTIASRMENLAEPGTVLVSDNTYRLVRNQFEWLLLGEIPIKGMSHPMPVFRPLVHIKTVEPGQDELAYGFTYGIIGRKKEQQVLKKSIEDLYAGRGAIFLVNGVKGMGKSFLVNQTRQHLARQNALFAAAQSKDPTPKTDETEGSNPANVSIRWLHGRCRSYGHLRPYSIWLDLLHEWLGTHPEDQAGEVAAVLRMQIETQWDSDVEKEYPNLAPFLSTPIEEMATERLKHMDAEGIKRQFFLSVRDWIQHLVQQGPLVVSFADVQWTDSSSLDLLEFCLPLCDSEPILWMLVYRPERDSVIWEFEHKLKTNYPHRLIDLSIPPLTTEESEEFIYQFLGKDILHEDALNLIIKKSEGNPYFIKELIFSLIAQKTLMKSDDEPAWKQVKPVNSLDLPDSLQGLLMARIDRLSQGERRVLQMAAVIGSVFWLNVLQAIAVPPIPLTQLQNDIVVLQRTGLIHERAYVEDLGMEYAFDSSLIREVAYESLLNTQRVAYHLRIAEYLEEIVFQEGKRRYFNTLAHHYRLAGDIKKELFYTLQAAERAQNIYANVEALRYYSRALELLQQIEFKKVINGHQKFAILTQKFEALNGRRAVHFLIGNIEAGWEDARALLPLARQMEQDPTWLIDALLQQPGVSSAEDREELEHGVPLAAEALELAVKIGDKRREMNCLLAIASQRNLLNDPAWVEVGDRALTLSREIGDRQYEAMILLGLGHAYVGRDELEKGMGYLNAALPICQALDNRVTELILLRVMGAQFERSGDHYLRLTNYEQKRLRIAREIGDRFEEANSLMFCGQIQALNLGDLEGGLNLLRESLKILEIVSGKIFPLLRTAQVQIALGQYEDAQQSLEDAEPVANRNVFDLGRVGLKMVRILLYNALGDTTHLQLALEMANEINLMEDKQLVSRQYRMAAACETTFSQLSLARLATGETERIEHLKLALESSKVAVEVYNRFGYVNIVECTSEEIFLRHNQSLAANGFQEDANEYLEMAYSEMMRKYDFIPQDSYFRRTYLENIVVHREIRAAHTASTLAKNTGMRNSKI
ncbi:MAG: DUF2791 family P-loop domain-containing protein [Anaerolineaceae bacterium]|nr:DUF2791 family P-loop domain-containing protein [Anaerolineaceae bacterium]